MCKLQPSGGIKPLCRSCADCKPYALYIELKLGSECALCLVSWPPPPALPTAVLLPPTPLVPAVRFSPTCGRLLLLPPTRLCWVTTTTKAWLLCGTCSTTSQGPST